MSDIITNLKPGDTFVSPTDGLTYVKHSARTLREPCNRCGSTDTYWAHRWNGSTGRWCHEHAKSGFVRVNRDGTVHVHKSSQVTYSPAEYKPEPMDAPSYDGLSGLSAPVEPQPEPQPAPKPATGNVLQDALLALGDALSNGLDLSTLESRVMAKVDQRLTDFSVPVSVKVERPDGSAVTVQGTHKVMPKVLAAASAGQHVLMVGPMGTGKSTIASQVAEALGRDFAFIACGPQTSKTDIVGYMTADGTYVPALFRKVYEHGGVFLFDEIDASHPGVLTLINSALANGHMAFPDGMVTRHPDTLIFAAANTYGRGADRMYVGRQAIDAATLDRFAVLNVDVDETVEESMCHATGLDGYKVRAVLSYVRQLRASASDQKVPVGFSPRASAGMCSLLAAGFTVADAIDARVRRGLSDADWSKVSHGAITPSF